MYKVPVCSLNVVCHLFVKDEQLLMPCACFSCQMIFILIQTQIQTIGPIFVMAYPFIIESNSD